MKIFLPFQKESNPYLEEIIRHSKNEFIYAPFEEYNRSFKIVNIHWPEALFNWKEPTNDQLNELECSIKKWKKNSILVYTKHDFERNKGTTPNFTRLFQIIEENTEVFIHLGEYSKEYYQEKYPDVRHFVVYHPLYEETFRTKKIPQEKARELLDIDKGAIVIIVPGNIRSFKERKLVLKGFRKFPEKNKVLIATNMRTELRFDFRGRVRLKRLFDLREIMVGRFKKKNKPPQFLFTYGRLNNEELSLKMSAADIVLVPRLNTLNSGIVFLGFTFKKIVVGPAVGNIQESLETFSFPLFQPEKASSVAKALFEAAHLIKNDDLFPEIGLDQFKPSRIAKQIDDIFFKVLNEF